MPFARIPAVLILAGLWAPTGPAGAQNSALDLRLAPSPEPVLTISAVGWLQSIYPQDIAAMEISESGGITDIFVRLGPEATANLADLTGIAIGQPLAVRACSHLLLDPVVRERIESGTLYIHDTNAVRAEALRALWHGRTTCADLDAEIFHNGQ